MTEPAFLADHDLRPVTLKAGAPFTQLGLALGQGQNALEVVAVASDGKPSEPRVLVVLHESRALLCGPTAAGAEPPVHPWLEQGQAERLCREALDQPDCHAAYLWLLFAADALAEGGTLDDLLEKSKDFADDLAVRLRDRIYGEVVPRLAQGLADARKLKKPTAKDLAETYQMAMTVLFRLLFIAYAEDKNLLPYRFNGLYQRHALKTLARELVQKYPHGLPAVATSVPLVG